jgi:hypothetical protein
MGNRRLRDRTAPVAYSTLHRIVHAENSSCHLIII